MVKVYLNTKMRESMEDDLKYNLSKLVPNKTDKETQEIILKIYETYEK